MILRSDKLALSERSKKGCSSINASPISSLVKYSSAKKCAKDCHSR